MEPEESKIPKHKTNKHTDDLIDHYWGSIDYVSSLIKASEIKAGLILSFYGILLNFSYKYIEMILVSASTKPLLYVLLGAWFLCTMTSIYFSVRCFMPRIEADYEKNIFFFGDVISKFGTIKEFSKAFYRISMDENQVFDQLGQQIYIISKIAAIKFKYVNKSLRFLAVGLFLLLVVVGYNMIVTTL
ncbi:Pycsar system effector family protein [Formosa maritima]|uniref:ABC transporter ATP-binding protein n=1 Tax=Formosa maritima TaxID=2592046 RepID=A0A5D0GFL7_9FLAO|nr:Pycsar system effector family protein [Formosa maritima]TYA57520.1 ABC transporter ATP-binding protein [Formosa maritima]